MELSAKEIFRLHVQCEKDMEVGDSGTGCLRVIPIVGGTFDGEISGRVIPGGADWNTMQPNGIGHAFAKYVIQTDGGEYIAVENEGFMDVKDFGRKIKTRTKFQIDGKSKYAWLNSGVFVGELDPGAAPGQVEIVIYKLD